MRLNIAILGHTGMLGTAVRSWFSRKTDAYNLICPTVRYSLDNPRSFLHEIGSADFVINCAGAIPQSVSNTSKDYYDINFKLPDLLLSHDFKIIHACTDCVFSGTPISSAPYSITSEYDASDPYGLSKSRIYKLSSFASHQSNIRIIRSSIIGPDKQNKSLYSWLISSLSSTSSVNGFTNHFWNGITTLQWAIYAENIINNFYSTSLFTVPVSDRISKYQLLCSILTSLGHNKNFVKPVEHPISKDKSLTPTEPLLYRPLELQLNDLADFSLL